MAIKFFPQIARSQNLNGSAPGEGIVQNFSGRWWWGGDRIRMLVDAPICDELNPHRFYVNRGSARMLQVFLWWIDLGIDLGLGVPGYFIEANWIAYECVGSQLGKLDVCGWRREMSERKLGYFQYFFRQGKNYDKNGDYVRGWILS